MIFRAILTCQWRWARYVVVAATVAGFVIPLLAVQGATGGDSAATVLQLMDSVAAAGGLFPLLAAGAALLVALSAWAADHRGGHLYPLTLPLPRWRFVLCRGGAGLLLLMGPVAGVWIGSLLAVNAVHIPAGLEAYPNLLTLRFLLCMLVAYGAFFSIAAGSSRTAGYILAGLLLMIGIQVLLDAMNQEINLLNWLTDRLFVWPGPLEIFTGGWRLIDV